MAKSSDTTKENPGKENPGKDDPVKGDPGKDKAQPASSGEAGQDGVEMVSVGGEAEPKFKLTASRQFPNWMAEQRLSIGLTTYEAGKLFLIGLQPEGRLSVFERTFNRCMGLWSNGQTILMSSLFQLWRFENALQAGQVHQGYDRLYVPQTAYTTGDIDIHDVSIMADGRVIFVNTLFSCLATISETHSFQPLWHPKFISRLAAEDRCHLNGLAMDNGKPRYVTAVSQSDIADGWRDRRSDGGCVIDVENNDVVVNGLSMPHSPRVHKGTLYLLDSGTGFFGKVDPVAGRFEPIAFCPGYGRGLAFAGDFAIIGLSKPRKGGSFTGLKLDDNLTERDATARAGVLVINLQTGDIVHWLRIDAVFEEIYDVVTLPGVIRPSAIGLKTDEIRRTLTVADMPAKAAL